MKVLIVGAKGMLGQELVRVFGSGNTVVAWDFEDIDITRPGIHEQILPVKPDVIINSVAYNNVDGAESEPGKANLLNWDAVGRLAVAARELNCGFVHFSTDYVFSGKRVEGYTEKVKPNPISAYGHSKYMGEQLLQSVMKEKFWIIRLSRLFGRPAISAAGKLSFPAQLRKKAETEKVITMVDEEYSAPTYAPDLAEATRQIVDENRPAGIYHRTNEGAATWYAYALQIIKFLNLDVELKPISGADLKRPAKRPQFSVLLNTKLPPMRPWQEALAEFLAQPQQ